MPKFLLYLHTKNMQLSMQKTHLAILILHKFIYLFLEFFSVAIVIVRIYYMGRHRNQPNCFFSLNRDNLSSIFMWGHQNQSLHTLATYIDYLIVLCHHHFKKENFAVDPHLSVATKLVTVFIKVIV